jgi:hypothetical protein
MGRPQLTPTSVYLVRETGVLDLLSAESLDVNKKHTMICAVKEAQLGGLGDRHTTA